MITPTVGRIVLYRGSKDDREIMPGSSEPLAAVVAYVCNEKTVHLCVFDANGHTHGRQSVPLVQDGETAPEGAYCEWMPYQKGQAAEVEALERERELVGVAQ